MKTKRATPNAQRPMPNLESEGDGIQINDSSNTEYGGRLRNCSMTLKSRLLDFAVKVVEFDGIIADTKAEIISRVNSCVAATSPLPITARWKQRNRERISSNKLRLCLKELRETKRWLRLVSRLKRLGEAENVTLCLNEVNELIRIFAASVEPRKITRNDVAGQLIGR